VLGILHLSPFCLPSLSLICILLLRLSLTFTFYVLQIFCVSFTKHQYFWRNRGAILVEWHNSNFFYFLTPTHMCTLYFLCNLFLSWLTADLFWETTQLFLLLYFLLRLRQPTVFLKAFMFLGCPIRSPGQILLRWYLMNGLNNSDKTPRNIQ